MTRLVALLMLTAMPAAAQTVVAAAPIRAGTVIEAIHLATIGGAEPGTLGDMRDAIGLEARVNLYANRPLRPEDLGAPTLVQRNERVTLTFLAGPLRITAEGPGAVARRGGRIRPRDEHGLAPDRRWRGGGPRTGRGDPMIRILLVCTIALVGCGRIKQVGRAPPN